MKSFLIVFFIFTKSVFFVQGADEKPAKEVPELVKLENQFKLAMDKQKDLATKPLNDLWGFYTNKMNTLKENFQKKGDLKRAVAAQEAVAKEPVTGTLDKQFDEIASIQKIFLTEKQKIVSKNIKGRNLLTQKFVKSLQSLKIKFTKSGDLEEALVVEKKINLLMEGGNNYSSDLISSDSGKDKIKANPVEDFIWESIEDDVVIKKFIGSSRKVVIPENIEGKPVRVLGDNVFNGCTNVTEIIIPESIIEIGVQAFFSTSLENLIIPDSVIQLGDYTFNSNRTLETVKISKNLKELPKFMFQNCHNLKEVTIPYGIKIIPERFISGCSSLRLIDIPESVVEISKGAFIKIGAPSLTIPKSVKVIGDGAFYVGMGGNPQSIIFEGSPPKVGSGGPFGDEYKISIYRLSDASGWEDKWLERKVNVIKK